MKLGAKLERMSPSYSTDVRRGEDAGVGIEVTGEWRWPRTFPKTYQGLTDKEMVASILRELLRQPRFLELAHRYGCRPDLRWLTEHVVGWDLDDGWASIIIQRW